MAVSVSSKSNVGARLKRARAERGIDLLEAARVTRIKPRFLDALERDAPPSAFRAPVYARAFLREYARFLGLDAEALVEEYRESHGEEPSGPLRLPAPVSPPRLVRWVPTIVTASILAALLTLAFVGVQLGAPAPLPLEPPPASRTTPPPVVASGARSVVLHLRVVDEPTWLQVVVDGEHRFRKVARPGMARTFRADGRIRIEVADGGAVRLRVNGESAGAPAPAGVGYRAAFVLRDGEVRVVEAG